LNLHDFHSDGVNVRYGKPEQKLGTFGYHAKIVGGSLLEHFFSPALGTAGSSQRHVPKHH
jgi:hypothetical protein